MNENKKFVSSIPLPTRQTLGRLLRWLLPNGGTLILLALFLFAQSVGAIPLPAKNAAPNWPDAPTINYQGRLADSAGIPINDTVAMQFALYDAVMGDNSLWGPESHPTVPVSDGLFSVGLGSQTAAGIPTSILSGDVWLEITVDGETLSPRELIRSVPIAGMALTVPDGAITASKLSSTALGHWTMFDNSHLIVHHVSSDSFDWQVADISAFVPTSTEMIYVHIFQKDTTGSSTCQVRPYGSTSNAGLIQSRTVLANKYSSEIGLVAVSETKFEYKCSCQTDATMYDIGVSLWGYYEPGY